MSARPADNSARARCPRDWVDSSVVASTCIRAPSSRQRATAFEGVSVTFTARAGEEGKLFGSITTADIAEKLGEQGIEVDRKQIQLDEPIKALGVFSVPVRLHAEVRPELKVWVIKED